MPESLISGRYSEWSPLVRLVHDFRIPETMRRLSDPAIGDHALHYFRSGSGRCLCGGRAVPVRPGRLFIVRPGEGYDMTFDAGSGVEMYNIRFDLEEKAEFNHPHPCPAADAGRKLRLPADGDFPLYADVRDAGRYEEIFLRMLAVWRFELSRREISCKGMLLELLGVIAAEAHVSGGVTGGGRLLETVEEFSRLRGAAPTPETLAEAAGLSRTVLYRRFRELTGTSLHRYFLEKRLLEAKLELMHTNDSVKVVADRCGFVSAQHFSRVFRAETGMAPGEFRRRHRF